MYRIRNILRAGQDNLTQRQRDRLEDAFNANDAHVEVDIAWQCAQRVRAAYQTGGTAGRELAEDILASFHLCPIPWVAGSSPAGGTTAKASGLLTTG